MKEKFQRRKPSRVQAMFLNITVKQMPALCVPVPFRSTNIEAKSGDYSDLLYFEKII